MCCTYTQKPSVDIVSVTETAAHIVELESVINLILKAVQRTLLCKGFLNS